MLNRFSHVLLFATVAHQAPLSMGFSRQEYWSGLPCPPPGDLRNSGIKLTSPALAGGFFPTSTTWDTLKEILLLLLLLSHFSRVQLFVTLWNIAHQAPLSMGFSRQQHWSGLPCPPPGDLPDPGVKSMSLVSPALAGRFFTTSATWKAQEEY